MSRVLKCTAEPQDHEGRVGEDGRHLAGERAAGGVAGVKPAGRRRRTNVMHFGKLYEDINRMAFLANFEASGPENLLIKTQKSPTFFKLLTLGAIFDPWLMY